MVQCMLKNHSTCLDLSAWYIKVINYILNFLYFEKNNQMT